MSALSDDLAQDGLALALDVHGQPIKVLTGDDANLSFVGMILVKEPDALITELSEDPREKVVIHFAKLSWPSKSRPGDHLLDASGITWNLIKLIDNPADNTIDWEAVKFDPTYDN